MFDMIIHQLNVIKMRQIINGRHECFQDFSHLTSIAYKKHNISNITYNVQAN